MKDIFPSLSSRRRPGPYDPIARERARAGSTPFTSALPHGDIFKWPTKRHFLLVTTYL